jgi:hypothetical protein
MLPPRIPCAGKTASRRRLLAGCVFAWFLLGAGLAEAHAPRIERTERIPAGPGTRALLTRGPYLQAQTASSIVLRWRSDVPGDSRVWYGSAPDSLPFEAVAPLITTEHEVKLQGLSPDTRYYYAVGDASGLLAGGDPDYFFTTGPTPGEPKPTRIWAIGDSGEANADAAHVRDAFLGYTGERGADLWLMLGDNAYDSGTDAEYQAAVFDMYPMLLRNTILWPTRGNHDFLHDGPNNDYYEIFTLPRFGEAGGFPSGSEAYYSLTYGDVHLVCLDSEGSLRGRTDPMLTWLRQDLAQATTTWILAFWHHPPYTHSNHNSDIPDDSGGRLVDMRENALPILEEAGVDLVLNGHSHSYERSFLLDEHYGFSWTLADSMILDGGDGDPAGDGEYHKATAGPAAHEGTVYAVAGSSSKVVAGSLDHPVMVVSLRVLGSLVIDIDHRQLDAIFLDDQGAVRDRFTITKGNPQDAPPAAESIADMAPASPNPFTERTRLRFTLKEPADVDLFVVDARGRRVASLLTNARLGTGAHAVAWDGRDARGRILPVGVYYQVLAVDGMPEARSMVLVR